MNPSSLHFFFFFLKNVDFENFSHYCRMNSESREFVTTYPNKISVSHHTFFFLFEKVTDSANFEYKEYRTNGAKLFRSIFT